eukprot:scaffold5173_cov125-Isochrysis_galbana.AAC.5
MASLGRQYTSMVLIFSRVVLYYSEDARVGCGQGEQTGCGVILYRLLDSWLIRGECEQVLWGRPTRPHTTHGTLASRLQPPIRG